MEPTFSKKLLRLRFVAIFLSIITLFNACSTRRINQFDKFAKAGENYASAMVKLTEEAGKIKIEADSEILQNNRNILGQAERRQTYIDHTNALKNNLKVIGDLREHSGMLRKYFAALSTLAQSDAPSGIGEEASNIVTQLQEFSPRLVDAKIGNSGVSSYIKPVVTLSIAHYQKISLNRHLKVHASTIERQLELQEAVLTALSAGLKSDLETLTNALDTRKVAIPYVQNGNLPKTWKADRTELLSSKITAASLKDASDAAANLRKTFIALVENKVSSNDFDILFSDISAILDVIELTQATTEE